MSTATRNLTNGYTGFHFLTQRTRLMRSERNSKPDGCSRGSVEGVGSKNSPLGVESCEKDSCSMGSGGWGGMKEKEKDMRTN